MLPCLIHIGSLFDTPSATGLALIFGGAIGNVFDRVRAGSVTGFLDFYSGATHKA